MAMADENSPVFVARGMNAFASMFLDKDKLAVACKGDGGWGWAEHHACLFKGTEWFFHPGYRAYLPSDWLPALDGVDAKLRAGATVADVGCGHGASVMVMARAYPQSRMSGVDFHPPSIETAKARAIEAGVAERTTSRWPTPTDMTASTV
ncbi:MAG TPA: methyltransferase domain-containing protein [Acidimicrobiales bacterium]|nr:methyltransferase domain-containing protein [Acidimicrobiales bacterium]